MNSIFKSILRHLFRAALGAAITCMLASLAYVIAQGVNNTTGLAWNILHSNNVVVFVIFSVIGLTVSYAVGMFFEGLTTGDVRASDDSSELQNLHELERSP